MGHCQCLSFLPDDKKSTLKGESFQILIWLMPMGIYRCYCTIQVHGWSNQHLDSYRCFTVVSQFLHSNKRLDFVPLQYSPITRPSLSHYLVLDNCAICATLYIRRWYITQSILRMQKTTVAIFPTWSSLSVEWLCSDFILFIKDSVQVTECVTFFYFSFSQPQNAFWLPTSLQDKLSSSQEHCLGLELEERTNFCAQVSIDGEKIIHRSHKS